jgi:hypothetical protein
LPWIYPSLRKSHGVLGSRIFLHVHILLGVGGGEGIGTLLVFTDLLEMLLLLLEGLGGLEQLVVRLVESDLQLLDLLSIVADITVSLQTKRKNKINK